MCARRFLIVIFILTLLFVAGAFAIFQFGQDVLIRSATPRGDFEEPAPQSGPDYAQASSWIARPGIADDPSEWRPATQPPAQAERPAHVFFIHPTTYLERDRWNDWLTEPQSRQRADLFVRSQSSAFNSIAEVWAPRYRQAAYGAFLLHSDDAQKALDFAYSDVERAFAQFLAEVPDGSPLILAGHSQGSLHLIRLLTEQGPALRNRLVAAYVAGWPVSVTADLPPMGLAACAQPTQNACVISWQSFAEPANQSLILDAWVGTRGASNIERRRADMLCVNPLTGTRNAAAPPQSNPGSLVPTTDLADAALAPQRVGARCEDGFLIIDGDIPNLGPFVLPGNNYHVYDYALFWAAIRADAERRLAARTGAA